MSAEFARASDLQARASDPQGSVWVNANAGSGKTHVLVNRVVRLLLNGTAPERILCLTYTKAAAAEMSDRLFDELAGWIALDNTELMERICSHTGHSAFRDTDHVTARRLFTRALETPGGLKVQTIHAFCERLLQRFPVEAGVVPGFEVMDDQRARELRQKAAETVLAEAKTAPQSALAQHLAVLAGQTSSEAFDDLVKQLIDKRRQVAPMVASQVQLCRASQALHRVLGTRDGETEHQLVGDFVAALDTEKLAMASEVLSARTTKTDQAQLELITRLASTKSAEGSFKLLSELFCKADGDAKADRSLMSPNAARDHPDVSAFLVGERDRFVAVMSHIKALHVHRATMALLALGAGILHAYETAKRQAGLYDYDDLIIRAMELLDQRGASQWVLYKLDGGLDHILIDEAQDTSPEQWRIIEQLSAEFFAGVGARSDVDRTIFAVGDRKQSIYSFQGADPAEFDRMRRHFARHVANAGQTLAQVPLQVSFRSTPEILEIVDRVFKQPEAAQGLALPGSGVDVHAPTRAGQSGRVELWDLEEPDDRPDTQWWAAPDSEHTGTHPRLKLAARIADAIKSWVDNEEELTPRGRPIRYGDILILVRNRTTFADAIVRALKLRGIPVAGADRLRLTRHIAVQDLLSLVKFVLLPLDDLSLAEVLKSPLVARDDGKPIDDDDLFAIAHDRGRKSLWESLQRAVDGNAPFSKALAALRDWRRQAGFETPFEFFSRVLTIDRRRESILARLGTEASEPLDALLAEAMRFEQSHAPDLNGFCTWLEGADIQIKRDMDHSGNEVRVMTVHGAKGLEANVVILPDTNNVPDSRKIPAILIDDDEDRDAVPFWRLRKQAEVDITRALGSAYQQRMREEENRLLYVAMTRARDRLYVCGHTDRTGKVKDGSWYSLVEGVIKQYGQKMRDEVSGREIWRIDGKQEAAPFEREETGEPELAALRPPDWCHVAVPPEDDSMVWVVASKLAGAADRSVQGKEEQAQSPLAGDRGDSFARGILIHRLLQLLPETASGEQQSVARRYLTLPAHGLDENQIADILGEVFAILHDPVFAPVFAPGSRAEVPLTARIEMGTGPVGLIGQVDRLAVTDNEVLIVDYKTNRPPPENIAAADRSYIRQLAGYRAALSAIYPEKQVRAGLLWTSSATFMAVPDAMLDAEVPVPARVT